MTNSIWTADQWTQKEVKWENDDERDDDKEMKMLLKGCRGYMDDEEGGHRNWIDAPVVSSAGWTDT